jgi:hypothetical protein
MYPHKRLSRMIFLGWREGLDHRVGRSSGHGHSCASTDVGGVPDAVLFAAVVAEVLPEFHVREAVLDACADTAGKCSR